MLTPRNGTPKALQRLVAEQLLPLAIATPPDRLRLAVSAPRQDENLPPPGPPAHQHFFAEICFCLEGEAEFWAGGCLQRVGRGDALIVPPAVFHSSASLHAVTIPPKDAYSRLLWMALFPYGCVVNLCESSGGNHYSTPRQLVVERHANLRLQEMLLELRSGDAYAGLIAKCKLIEGLAWLCRGDERQWTHASAGLAELPPVSVPDERSVSGRARRFIEEHFDRRLDLDSIAQAVCTNKSNLCRVFRNDTSVTVGEYLTRIRVDASKKLLLTSLSVAAVARLVGFEDPYYFSRVFRRATGMAPTEYRTIHEPEKCHPSFENAGTVETPFTALRPGRG
jgi:AraC-like DNA-binding protein/mannose-6-phosphate isomerase-like protein (cupin superfamily)